MARQPAPPARKQSGLNISPWRITFFEAAASIFFGTAALSVALIGFGLDSIVESLSGHPDMAAPGITEICRRRKRSEPRRAERFVSVTFFILGIYILYESINHLVTHEIAQPSLAGIIIALLSVIIMPVLAWRKRVIGTVIGSRALMADAKETTACALLSVALLAGLLANYRFGFWQADPLIGIVIVLYLFHEGYATWCGSCGGCECTSGG